MKHITITLDSTQKKTHGLATSSSYPTSILVPVDSSGSAFNSLAYTLRLAKIWNAGIHLLYLIDIDEVPDSDSAFVIEGAMNRLESKASICLESLRELIQETGVKVITAEHEMGRIQSLLPKKINSINPELIVTGRGGLDKKVLTRLVRQSTCPVLIVPDAAAPTLPSSVLLLNGPGFRLKNIESLSKITVGAARELHILSHGGDTKPNYNGLTSENVPIRHHDGIEETVEAVSHFVKTNGVEIICSVLPDQSFLQRIFNRCFPLDLARKLDVPVLIIPNH